MKRAAGLIFTMILVASLVLACGPSPVPTPNVQATVDAAIAATAAAQATSTLQDTLAAGPTPDTQATIQAAVAATIAAQQTLDAIVQATVAAAPTPTPAAEYVTMTEEELAALVDEAVAEATAETQACAEASAAATADDTVTAEEVETIEDALAGAEEAIAYAEELLAVYESLYGELAAETLLTLQAIEEDLAALVAATEAINATLLEIEMTLEQGLTLAEETIAQLEAAAQAASAKSAELQAASQGWVEQLSSELETRAAAVLSVLPDNIPSDRLAAVRSAFDYVDTVRQALLDNKVSPAELSDIARRGANASAGLKAHGGPQLQSLGDSINQVTAQVARGQRTQAKAGLAGLETALGPRPRP